MRGTTFLVFASFILPIFAGPQIVDTVVSRTSTKILDGRTPLIEAIPVQGRSAVTIEREVETESSDLLAERMIRGGRGRGGDKRSVDERATRGGRGRGGDKRLVDERATRGGRGRGGDKRSVDERAIRGGKGDKRSVDERAIRGGKGDKRSVDERAIRGGKGDRRSLMSRSIRGGRGRGGD
ncbi:uncharacterized protein J4E79_005451 [Alternaria viburni]|uniref:uncharacterized protein n=1 Tax=Alternaria viburni TaxID=566460 RepID=UPI0020C292A4|nr:uncharacterized protein J4E79_005451 [Alternaria viburni]KAI4660883.1 hypothetical protein J4E79_005451 [Alternaria viburni]